MPMWYVAKMAAYNEQIAEIRDELQAAEELVGLARARLESHAMMGGTSHHHDSVADRWARHEQTVAEREIAKAGTFGTRVAA